MQATFGRFAKHCSSWSGSPTFFVTSVLLVVVWLGSGPFLGFDERWNFWANTSTTITTWLLVILLQNTQNRDTSALQLKLDELILANRDARNRLLNLEDLDQAELERIKAAFVKLA